MKKSIGIVDLKQCEGRSWRITLQKEYTVIVLKDLSPIENKSVDIVIINMHMFKEFDLNIIRKIWRISSSLPIIVLSSYRYWSQAELMKWGVENVVIKPFAIFDLKKKIVEIFRNKRVY